MEFRIERKIYAYDFMNPPAEDRSFDIDLVLINSNGSLKLSKQTVQFMTLYLLTVPDPLSVGFTSPSQTPLKLDTQNFVLAMNLALTRLGITTDDTQFSSANVQFGPSKTQVMNQGSSGRNDIAIGTAGIGTSYHLTARASENLDERVVIRLFQKLQHLDRFNIKGTSSLPAINLSKALREYEAAIADFDRLVKFKHLFNAIEFIANLDGKDRKGSDLDNEIALKTGVQKTDAETWRRFYDRTKHVDRDVAEVTRYIEGMENVPSLILELRKCANQMIANAIP